MALKIRVNVWLIIKIDDTKNKNISSEKIFIYLRTVPTRI